MIPIIPHHVSLIIEITIFAVMLRGIMSGDPRYEQSDIWDHLDGIFAKDAKESVMSLGEPLDTLFSDYIPDTFVRNRSLVLGGLMDGLSLPGKMNASDTLEEGSELWSMLSHIPLEAISKILFARPDLDIEDVIETLYPGEVFQQSATIHLIFF